MAAALYTPPVEYDMIPDEKSTLLQVAQQIHTKTGKGVQWVEPRLCCRVQYLERSETGNLRYATFKRFLFEKRAENRGWTA